MLGWLHCCTAPYASHGVRMRRMESTIDWPGAMLQQHTRAILSTTAKLAKKGKSYLQRSDNTCQHNQIYQDRHQPLMALLPPPKWLPPLPTPLVRRPTASPMEFKPPTPLIAVSAAWRRCSSTSSHRFPTPAARKPGIPLLFFFGNKDRGAATVVVSQREAFALCCWLWFFRSSLLTLFLVVGSFSVNDRSYHLGCGISAIVALLDLISRPHFPGPTPSTTTLDTLYDAKHTCFAVHTKKIVNESTKDWDKGSYRITYELR